MKRVLFITTILINALYPYFGSQLFHDPPSDARVGKDLILKVVSLSDLTVIDAKGYYRVRGSVSFQGNEIELFWDFLAHED